jgi:hypothetical protein
MLTTPNYLYNNMDTSSTNALPGFDPFAESPAAGTQGMLGFAGDAQDGPSPMAMLNNVSPTNALLSASGSPNATFAPTGRTGIATQNTATGQIDLLWFSGVHLTGSELLVGDFLPVVGAADINGNGKTDLITQNANGGPLDFLSFTGANLTGSFQTSASFWPVHDATNLGAPGQTLMLSQDIGSGALDYLKFNGTSFVGSQLESGAYPGLTPIQGTQAALNLFPV